MTTFNEQDHPRERDGKFRDKPQASAGVALAVAPSGSVFTTRYETLEDKVAAIQAELDARITELSDDESWERLLHTMTKFPKYSFHNQLLIQVQRPDASRVAGFKRWGDVGRHVRKGERGITILAPRVVRGKVRDDGGNVELGDDGKPVVSSRVVGFTTATVFDVSQTDGEPLADPMNLLSDDPPEGFVEDLESAAAKLGFPVSYEQIDSGSDGYTTKADGGRIVVDSRLTPARRASVLAHELGHVACGHMDRDDYHTGDGGHRGAMEVEAESVSYVLARLNGMRLDRGEVSQGHAAYIGYWSTVQSGGVDTQTLRDSGTHVAGTVKALLEGHHWRNVVQQ